MRTQAPKRGRPSKFDRPSRAVALTLPSDVIAGLQKLNTDLARAIVTLFEKGAGIDGASPPAGPGFELVGIPDRQFLIVVNRGALRRFSGIDIVPLDGERAFLALAPGKGIGDLELAVIDRLEEADLGITEREALTHLRGQLYQWRRDPTLQFEPRAIIVAQRRSRRTKRPRAR